MRVDFDPTATINLIESLALDSSLATLPFDPMLYLSLIFE